MAQLDNIMIENIIILLVANTVLPYVPIEPAWLLPLPLGLLPLQPPSAFANMNLSRLYRPEQFKRTFRESLKVHHPDHGGSQQVFQQIQGLKKIMQEPVNYYDLYNITDVELSSNSPLKIKDVVEIKRVSFFVELGMFYFIALLYILAFTLEEDSKRSRNVMMALAVGFLAYEYFVHENPGTVTVIDLLSDRVPLFEQRNILKRTFIILMAVIRSHFLRRKNEEKALSEALGKEHTIAEYRDILGRLAQLYRLKAIEKDKYEKSIWASLRGKFSKGLSCFFIFLVVKNALSY